MKYARTNERIREQAETQRAQAAQLTWRDVANAHLDLQKGLYTSERDIFQREADYLNKLIADRTKAVKS